MLNDPQKLVVIDRITHIAGQLLDWKHDRKSFGAGSRPQHMVALDHHWVPCIVITSSGLSQSCDDEESAGGGELALSLPTMPIFEHAPANRLLVASCSL